MNADFTSYLRLYTLKKFERKWLAKDNVKTGTHVL